MTEENKANDVTAFTAVRHLRHSGRKVKPGERVELSEQEADELLKLGAVKALEQTAEEKAAEKEKAKDKNKPSPGTPEK